MHTLISN